MGGSVNAKGMIVLPKMSRWKLARFKRKWKRAMSSAGRNVEPFWLCPVCNFLTRRPGTCDQCKRKETYPK